VPSLISATSTLSTSTKSSKKAVFVAVDPTNPSWKQNVRTSAACLVFPHLLSANGDVIRRQYEKDVQSMLLDSSFQYTAAQVEQLLQSLLQRVLRTPALPDPVPHYSPSHLGDGGETS
jgi:enterochelin esterase-like enzyme